MSRLAQSHSARNSLQYSCLPLALAYKRHRANMAAELAALQAQLQSMANKLDEYVVGQAQVISRLENTIASHVKCTDERLQTGDGTIQQVMRDVEQKIATVGGAQTQVIDKAQASVEQLGLTLEAKLMEVVQAMEDRMKLTESRMAEALAVLAATVQGSCQGAAPAHPGMPSAAQDQAGPTAAGVGAQFTRPPVPDPWWSAATSGVARDARASGRDSTDPTLRSKDFLGVDRFNGDISAFPDWSDRMAAKFFRAHASVGRLLEWAEGQTNPITAADEANVSDSNMDVSRLSAEVYDILTEKTGPGLFAKRRNAGTSRGLEFLRVLRRDYGTCSADAQLAKLEGYVHPSRCADVKDLGTALDRWEALGRELSKHVDDEFRYLGLRRLVPTRVLELMDLNVTRKYPDAMAYVRRLVADQRNAIQVQEVQKQVSAGPVPMDLGAMLAAAVEKWNGGESHAAASNTEQSTDETQTSDNPLEMFVAALKVKGKGNWQVPET